MYLRIYIYIPHASLYTERWVKAHSGDERQEIKGNDEKDSERDRERKENEE